MRLADIVRTLEAAWPPRLAEDWDSIGLMVGDPNDHVTKALVTVDVTDAVLTRAIDTHCDLIVAHHPLLRSESTVATTHPKGALVTRLIRHDIALFTAHTNADRAYGGVNDALAAALGLRNTTPLEQQPAAALDKWEVMVPLADTERVQQAMFAAGAGALGNYDSCSWRVEGTGQFRPLTGADPAIGTVGDVTTVAEFRLEMVAPASSREAVRAAVLAAHPYEEVAYAVLGVEPAVAATGLGRIGDLATPEPLRDFAARVATALPKTPAGIRVAGDLDAIVGRVAVCGGAGGDLIDTAAAAGADAYLTADLRHHVVDESLRRRPLALLDGGHWATEFPWCATVPDLLPDIEVTVFEPTTDPWSWHG